MKHGKFQKQVKDQLESQAAFVISLSGHRMQKNGLPDLDISHTRWKGRIEIKTEKDPCRPLQRIQAAKFELREVPCYVLRCAKYNPDAMHGIYWTIKDFCYSLENFDGKVIKWFDNLHSLLDILCDLELNKWNEG